MKATAPFLDVRSFVAEEVAEASVAIPAAAGSPFLSLFESDEAGGAPDPVTAERVVFLNELQDEEFDEALFELVNEAAELYEVQIAHEAGDPALSARSAERMLGQHFAPLVDEAHAMLGAIANEFGTRHPANLTADEIETFVESYQPSPQLAPSFDQFLGKLKRAVKKVARKAVSLAKKGLSAAAKLGLGPILNRLKGLIKPLLKRVIQMAIGKLPLHLQPAARKLAARLPFLKEVEESHEHGLGGNEACEVAFVRDEFNAQLVEMLFAESEVEQHLEVAQALSAGEGSGPVPSAELDEARAQFTDALSRLDDGEDPTPHVENFVPAILPALRVGIRLVGRKRVVDFLSKLLGKLVQRFVGPKLALPLSQAIVDAGLKLVQLEATSGDEARAAASAVAATVEETVRRVAGLPDEVLDNQELLEGFVLESFEQAAAANLPQVLSRDTYRRRPDLAEAIKLRGVWVMMPRGRRKRFKKFTRRIPVSLMPHRVRSVASFDGVPLDEFLEEELGMLPGEEIEGLVHLYESLPGTRLSDIARLDGEAPGLEVPGGYQQLHPLTQEAAALLLGEPELGRDSVEAGETDRHTLSAGQRFYYLEVPGKRLLTTPQVPGRATVRRPTQVRLTLDFPKNEIRVRLFLSEVRAQQIAVKLRQRAHPGAVAARLGRILERGLRASFGGAAGRLRIIHEAIAPEQWLSALRRLPSSVPRLLVARLQTWILRSLADAIKQQAEQFLKAAEETGDGVTVLITIANPPGFGQLQRALKGKGIALDGLSMGGGSPVVKIDFKAGYAQD